MKTQISGASQNCKFPQTLIYSLLDDQLLVCLRSWNGTDANQKVVDEISHFLSAANADLEVTTPYEFVESLSSLANKVRIATLLANDNIHKTENKDTYTHGYELAIIFKNQQEISWATVGRYEICAIKNKKKISIINSGHFLDDEILLPVALLGLDREPTVLAGSLSVKHLESLQIESNYDERSTYWHVVISDFV
jgi:subtilase family serine protease